jgi:hypothetical protein
MKIFLHFSPVSHHHPRLKDQPGHTFYIYFEEGEDLDSFKAWFDSMSFEGKVVWYPTYETKGNQVTTSMLQVIVVAKTDRDAMTIKLSC